MPKTIVFEDNGQDFLEWDIDDSNVVTTSRPFQTSMWAGVTVLEYIEGRKPLILIPGEVDSTQLIHRVKEIK